MGYLWFEADEKGRCWHARSEFTGFELQCRSVYALDGECIDDGKHRGLPVNHCLRFDESKAFFVDPVASRRQQPVRTISLKRGKYGHAVQRSGRER